MSTGNVGIGNTSPGAKLDIGSAGTTLGTMRLEGNTSGYVQIQPTSASGSWTLTLPSFAGTANYVLQTDGSGNTSWVSLGGSGTALGLGTSATATNPQRPGQAGTGLYSDTSNEVEVAIGGANLVTWSASAENLTGTITQGSYSIGYQINGNNAVWQDAANENLAVGLTAFPTTANAAGGGTNNTAIGYQALNANTTGAGNTAVGYNTLGANTTGNFNTALGGGALANNTTGVNNTAVGMEALVSNTTGYYNTAVGYYALSGNTTGNFNTAVGLQALIHNTTGVNNTAVGYYTLQHAMASTDNTAFGYHAMGGPAGGGNYLTGQYNTGIGDSALGEIRGAGANNTALGYSSGVAILTGTDNTLVGYEAGLGVTGNSNIIIGEDTSSAITTGGSNILIGNSVSSGLTNTASNQINIGNTIFGKLVAASGGTALVIGTSSDDGAIMTFAGDGGIVLPSGSTAQRPGASVANGMIRYNSDSSGAVEAYINGAWDTLLTSAGSTSGVNLGTSTTTTNPSRSGQIDTGLYSATAGHVSIAVDVSGTGTQVADFLSTGESVTGSVTASTSVISPLYTATGATVIKSGSDSTTAVQIETSGGSGIVDIDTTNSLVGIGTTAPDALLQVSATGEAIDVGNGTGTDTYISMTGDRGRVGNNGGYSYLYGNSKSVALKSTLGPGVVLTTAGNVGIGGNITDTTGLTGAQMVVDASGNVGIGNTAPGAKLDIGLAGTTEGTLRLESSTASSYVQIQPSTTSGSWTMTLPSSAGTSGYVLQTDGSGNTSWVSQGSGATINLGTSASATNPQRNGQPGTGLYSDTSNEVEVAIGGANLVTWSASAENLTGTITQGSYSIGYKINGNNAIWQDATNTNLAVGATSFPTTVSQAGAGNNGQYNTAVGVLALNANTTGYANTAVGTDALGANTTGNYNTVVGSYALNKNTTGTLNTAIGQGVLTANTTGSSNTAVGQSALAANTTGGSNVGIGNSALGGNTTGNNNTAVGYAALSSNSTGVSNTALGYQAGYDVTSGGQNIIIGNYPTTGVGITSGSNNILIGQNLQEFPLGRTSSNQLNIGNLIFGQSLTSGTTMSTGTVGIGTTGNTNYMLDVGGSAAIVNNNNTSTYKLFLASGDANHYIYSKGSSGNSMYFGEWTGTFHFYDTQTSTDVLTLSTASGVNVNSNKIINVATPTSSTDAANKAYVDAHAGSAPTWHLTTFTSSGTYTLPTGAYAYQVVLVGGGGGGGSGTTYNNGYTTYYDSGGGGGGGGMTYISSAPSTANVTVTIGAGGSANTAGGNTTASDGTITLTAYGGGAPTGGSAGGVTQGGAGGALPSGGVGGPGGTGGNGASWYYYGYPTQALYVSTAGGVYNFLFSSSGGSYGYYCEYSNCYGSCVAYEGGGGGGGSKGNGANGGSSNGSSASANSGAGGGGAGEWYGAGGTGGSGGSGYAMIYALY